jgi:hypothetical protein
MSDALKLAMSKGFMNEDDLFSTDNLVLEKLRESNDEEIIDKLNLISNFGVIEDKNNYDFHLKSKVRCVDPKIIVDEKLARLSGLDESYKTMMNDFISETSKGFFVKIKRKF